MWSTFFSSRGYTVLQTSNILSLPKCTLVYYMQWVYIQSIYSGRYTKYKWHLRFRSERVRQCPTRGGINSIFRPGRKIAILFDRGTRRDVFRPERSEGGKQSIRVPRSNTIAFFRPRAEQYFLSRTVRNNRFSDRP